MCVSGEIFRFGGICPWQTACTTYDRCDSTLLSRINNYILSFTIKDSHFAQDLQNKEDTLILFMCKHKLCISDQAPNNLR